MVMQHMGAGMHYWAPSSVTEQRWRTGALTIAEVSHCIVLTRSHTFQLHDVAWAAYPIHRPLQKIFNLTSKTSSVRLQSLPKNSQNFSQFWGPYLWHHERANLILHLRPGQHEENQKDPFNDNGNPSNDSCWYNLLPANRCKKPLNLNFVWTSGGTNSIHDSTALMISGPPGMTKSHIIVCLVRR